MQLALLEPAASGIKPRDYQEAAVKAAFDNWALRPSSSQLIIAPTRRGKTILIGMTADRYLEQAQGGRVLSLSHVPELIEQSYTTFRRMNPRISAGIYAAKLGRKDRRSKVTFALVQSVARNVEAFRDVGLIIVDECFVAGTPVMTPTGVRPIEELQVGDTVLNAVGNARIEAISMRAPEALIRITLANGDQIVCTPNHPFFTRAGWRPAGQLEHGAGLFGIKDVSALFCDDAPARKKEGRLAARREGAPLESDAVLLDLLLQEGGERYVGSGRSRKDGRHTQSHWPQAEDSQGQRSWADGASEADAGGSRSGLGGGVCLQDRAQEGPGHGHGLQARYCASRAHAQYRAGWEHSLRAARRTGFASGSAVDVTRVEHLSRAECESFGPVFDLQVAGHPSYFAGGVLVHNCHLIPHSSDGQYRDVIDGIRKARGGSQFVKILGLTATPWRLNSGNLLEPYKDSEPLFEEIAYEIDMLDMLEEGHLSRVVARGSKTKLDTSGVGKRMGEYKENELDAKFNTEAINKAIAKEIVAVGQEQERRSWLVFCITVDHATRMRDLIRSHDISCEMVCGETPTAERRRIVADFKAYKIRCLTSVNVLSTGFDHPGVDLGAMVRPTASPGLYLQQAGRLLRTTPGKKDAVLLDFAQNVFRHGLLTNVKGIFKNRRADDEDDQPKARECPECGTLNEPGTKVCVGCQFVWPVFERGNAEEKLSKHNVAERVMDDAVWAPVIAATFKHNEPAGRPATLRLFYQVQHPQTQVAEEVFCFNHPPNSYALNKSRAEWSKRTGLPPPANVIEAAQRMEELRRPRFVRVVQSDCGRFWNVKGTKI